MNVSSEMVYTALDHIPADVPVPFIRILYIFVRRNFPGITIGMQHGDLYVKHSMVPFVDSLYKYILAYNMLYVSYSASAETEFDCLIEALKNTKPLQRYATEIESLIRKILVREIFVATKSANKRA